MGRPRRSEPKMPVVSFTIEPAQMDFIDELAVRLRVPKSRIVREAIDRFMLDPNPNLHMQPTPTGEDEVA